MDCSFLFYRGKDLDCLSQHGKNLCPLLQQTPIFHIFFFQLYSMSVLSTSTQFQTAVRPSYTLSLLHPRLPFQTTVAQSSLGHLVFYTIHSHTRSHLFISQYVSQSVECWMMNRNDVWWSFPAYSTPLPLMALFYSPVLWRICHIWSYNRAAVFTLQLHGQSSIIQESVGLSPLAPSFLHFSLYFPTQLAFLFLKLPQILNIYSVTLFSNTPCSLAPPILSCSLFHRRPAKCSVFSQSLALPCHPDLFQYILSSQSSLLTCSLLSWPFRFPNSIYHGTSFTAHHITSCTV